jgi:hypothetical protein
MFVLDHSHYVRWRYLFTSMMDLGYKHDNTVEDLEFQNVKFSCKNFHSRPSAIAMHETYKIAKLTMCET